MRSDAIDTFPVFS